MQKGQRLAAFSLGMIFLVRGAVSCGEKLLEKDIRTVDLYDSPRPLVAPECIGNRCAVMMWHSFGHVLDRTILIFETAAGDY